MSNINSDYAAFFTADPLLRYDEDFFCLNRSYQADLEYLLTQLHRPEAQEILARFTAWRLTQ